MGTDPHSPFPTTASAQPQFGEAPTILSKPTLEFSQQADASGEWRWTLRNTGSGRILATSAIGYKNRQDCRKAIEQIRRSAAEATVLE